MCEYRLSRKKNSVDIDLLALLQDSDFNEAEVDAFKDEFTKRSLEMDEMWSYCHDKKPSNTKSSGSTLAFLANVKLLSEK